MRTAFEIYFQSIHKQVSTKAMKIIKKWIWKLYVMKFIKHRKYVYYSKISSEEKVKKLSTVDPLLSANNTKRE